MSLLEIVLKLAPALRGNPNIHAFWLEGSYATGKFHEKSDIDVWLDVGKDSSDIVLKDFLSELAKITPVRSHTELDNYSNDPKLAKVKIYLEGKSDEQRIELDMQEHDRDFTFSRNEHQIVTIFDKDGTIEWEE
jgi:predicted nucleotidyltransferase